MYCHLNELLSYLYCKISVCAKFHLNIRKIKKVLLKTIRDGDKSVPRDAAALILNKRIEMRNVIFYFDNDGRKKKSTK